MTGLPHAGCSKMPSLPDAVAACLAQHSALCHVTALLCDIQNQSVGIAEGIFGTFCAASGIPAGWFADRMRRDRTLRLCGFIMLGGARIALFPARGKRMAAIMHDRYK